MKARRRSPVAVVSVADRVYAVLRERISAGELQPDSRLHQEGISEELGVSRTPVREALARLAADGLVELLPNRGARVAAVSVEDIASSYSARAIIEPAAAQLAAERQDPAPLGAMRAAVAAQRRARPGTDAAFRATRDFHLALVDGSGNPFLLRFAESLWAGRIGLHVYLRQFDAEQLAADIDEHEEILAAIEAGDGAGAEMRTRRHVEAARKQLLEHARRAAEAQPVR